jgi:hypothetical protein
MNVYVFVCLFYLLLTALNEVISLYFFSRFYLKFYDTPIRKKNCNFCRQTQNNRRTVPLPAIKRHGDSLITVHPNRLACVRLQNLSFFL